MSTGSSSAARWSSSSPCSRSGRSSRPGPSGSRSHAGAVVVGLAAAGAPQGAVAGRPAIAGVAQCNNFVAGIVLDEQAHGTTRLGGWRAGGRGAGPDQRVVPAAGQRRAAGLVLAGPAAGPRRGGGPGPGDVAARLPVLWDAAAGRGGRAV